jgi:hypothetical protein
MQKPCQRCQEWKPFTDYHCNRAARDGRRDVCKACAIAKTRAWQRENPEQRQQWEDAHRDTRLARKRQQYHQNEPEQRQRTRQWRALNPEKHQQATRRWEVAHRSRRLAYLRSRLFMETGAMLKGLAWQDFQPIYDRAAALSRETGIPHQVDHIVPLNHPLVCGLHVPANLQVLTAKENRLKRNSFQPLMNCNV